jgi:ABC-type sugar transport system permease subunit
MATATPARSGIALPSGSKELRFQSGKISRFLLRDRTLGYLFLAPALLVVLCLVAYPFVNAVLMTFQSKTAGAPGRYIGLDNYRE